MSTNVSTLSTTLLGFFLEKKGKCKNVQDYAQTGILLRLSLLMPMFLASVLKYKVNSFTVLKLK